MLNNKIGMKNFFPRSGRLEATVGTNERRYRDDLTAASNFFCEWQLYNAALHQLCPYGHIEQLFLQGVQKNAY